MSEETAPTTAPAVNEKPTEPLKTEEVAAATADDDEVGFKVFVGNLAFTTTEKELAEHFGKLGKVTKAHIITRGNRSLGYGFVTYENEADAQKAGSEFDKKELGGREINVELAKPKSEGPAAAAAASRANGSSSSTTRGRPGRLMRGGFRGRGRGRGVKNAASETTEKGEGEEEAAAEGEAAGAKRGGRGRGRGRGAARVPRAPKGEPSENVIFVTNIPFTLDDEGLKKIFTNYKVTSAKVVRGFNERSKGFGFVEVADHAEQTKAIDELKNVEAEGRKLVLKVARIDQREAEVENAKEETPSASAAEAAPAETTTA